MRELTATELFMMNGRQAKVVAAIYKRIGPNGAQRLSYTEIARETGISRNSVRAAVDVLRHIGYIVIEDGKIKMTVTLPPDFIKSVSRRTG